MFCFFLFHDTATTEIYTYLYTLSRHDALPISLRILRTWRAPISVSQCITGEIPPSAWLGVTIHCVATSLSSKTSSANRAMLAIRSSRRSEEHTSELQSLMRISYAVFCLKQTTKSNI